VSEAIARRRSSARRAAGRTFGRTSREKDPEWGAEPGRAPGSEDGTMEVERVPIRPIPDELKQIIEEMS
jgi:hypothetical protein